MIGKPEKDNAPTGEFYILAFSPEKTWCHKMIWYYNTELKMTGLDNDTEFETLCKKGRISFELLLPWKTVYPYNPWLSESIGFNLCFVKAHNENEKSYYFMKEDGKMQSELSKRKYEILHFEMPQPYVRRFVSMLMKNNITVNEKPVVKVSGYIDKDTTEQFSIQVISGENSTAFYKRTSTNLNMGFSETDIPLESFSAISGGYKVRVYCGAELIGEHFLSVLPESDLDYFRYVLQSLDYQIPRGTFNTLMYYIAEIDTALFKLKDYECSYEIRNKIAEVDKYLNKLESGEDLIKSKKGVFRRAYFSVKDSTFHPYSVFIPQDYSENRKFPLLVYLHGSGDDDRVLSKTSLFPDGFVVLAPNGRGTSNCFTGYEAQSDIEDAISDVIENFNIDTGKIFISGFSMGGYGVLRTFYEHPERYRAISVISGHPDLARKMIDPEELNFLDDKNLRKFKNIPVFIYHGKNDLNCPYNLTEQLANKLRKNKCDVTFETDNNGHGNMSSEIRSRYFNWLKKQIEECNNKWVSVI